MIIGKWACKSYKKDGTDTVVNRKAYSLTQLYENGWEFLINKQIQYKHVKWNEFHFEKNNYNLSTNRTLTINTVIADSTYASKFQIIELSTDKLTVHSDFWKNTFFLIKE